MAKLSIITDPVTKQQFARDTDVAGSIYSAYTPPAGEAQAPAPSAQAPEAPSLTTLETPAPAPTGVQAPALPAPRAPALHDDYVTSLNEQAKLTRGAVENAYKAQSASIQEDIDRHNANIADIEKSQNVAIEK